MNNKKHIVILGAAESGVGAAMLAKKQGYDVWVSDNAKIKSEFRNDLNKYGIPFEEMKHTKANIFNASEVIISPGIPLTIPLVKEIKEKGIRVISEIEFASRFTDAHITAITGSNGKTTTASLIYELYKSGGLDVALVGNIGDSFAKSLANEQHDYYVVEISSFQLDTMYDFKADIAILLNITPDHLDRYNYKFENYTASKLRIFRNMTRTDSIIYNADDKLIADGIKDSKAIKYGFTQETEKLPNGNDGAFRKDNKIHFNIKRDQLIMDIEKLALQGRHNAYNTMAGGIAAKLQGIRNETVKGCFTNYQGVSHRLEKVATVKGIKFINDSKATNVNSTWYALESMTRPVIWIMGGQDKGNDYSSLIPLAKEKVKAIVCLGIDNQKIIETFGDVVPEIIETQTADDAVLSSFYMADDDDVVLLSPACASFDLFDSYEDRGDRFIRAVQDL